MESVASIGQFIEMINPVEVFLPQGEGLQLGDITFFNNGRDELPPGIKYAILGLPGVRDAELRKKGLGQSERVRALRGNFYRLFNHYRKPPGLLADLGDMRVEPGIDMEELHRRFIDVVSFLIRRGIVPVVIGEDSKTTSLGIEGAFRSKAFKSLGMLSCDSSPSLIETDEKGNNIFDSYPGLIPDNSMIIFGARRELVSPALFETVEKHKIRLFYKDKLNQLRRDLLFSLNSIQGPNDGVLLSFDMNSCDAASLPGSQDPLPGGFTPDEVIMIAKTLSKYCSVKYLDIVGLNPETDIRNATCSMAALFLFYFMADR